MKQSNSIITKLATAGVALAALGANAASPIIETDSITGLSVASLGLPNVNSYGLSYDFTIPEFNTLGGSRILTLVEWRFDVREYGPWTLSVTSGDGGDASISFQARYRVRNPDLVNTTTPVLSDVDFVTIPPTGNGTFDQSTFATGSSSAAAFLDLLNDGLPGTDTLWRSEGGSTTFSSIPTGTVAANFPALIDLSLEVKYHYIENNVVPEASTYVAMMPLAAFGVWAVRRRRAAAAK